VPAVEIPFYSLILSFDFNRLLKQPSYLIPDFEETEFKLFPLIIILISIKDEVLQAGAHSVSRPQRQRKENWIDLIKYLNEHKKRRRMTMKSIRLVLLIGMLAALPQSCTQTKKNYEQEVLKVENDWSEAQIKRDVAALKQFYADEYLATYPDGSTLNKSQDIENFASGDFKLISYKLEDIKVHVYGEVAVVTYLNTIKATFKDKDVSGSYRGTDVFVKRDGRWQCVATQGTVVANK
jgi:ketosteroid isomerase-like protein